MPIYGDTCTTYVVTIVCNINMSDCVVFCCRENISSNIIYECKIGLKDFNEEQYDKYLLTLNKYKIVYLISNDCIINIENKKIYTTDDVKYLIYKLNIPSQSKSTKFDYLIIDYEIIYIENICDFI